MASVASSGASPMPPFDHLQAELLTDDESWAFISQDGTSYPGSVGFFSSPESGSLRSYGIVGRRNQVQASPPAPSPLYLDQDQSQTQSQGQGQGQGHSHVQNQQHMHQQQHQLSVSPFMDPAHAFVDQQTSSPFANPGSFPDHMSFPDHASFMDQLSFTDPMAFVPSADPSDSTFVNPDVSGNLLSGQLFIPNEFRSENHDIQDFTHCLQSLSHMSSLPTAPSNSLESPSSIPSAQSLHIPLNELMALQSDANAPPWAAPGTTVSRQDQEPVFQMDDFLPSPNPPPASMSPSTSQSPPQSASPLSPPVKQEPDTQRNASLPINLSPSANAIRKVKGPARVGKKKSPPSDPPISTSAGAYKFITMTSESAAAQVGKPSMFECFERMTQRGRKGPLANETKENALQVRRVGACFCCHARKVKCDAERPCKNCKKLATQVPQIVCWQFQDFLTILFPDLIRGHFRKEPMAKFIADNVKGFMVGGAERTCVVELTSGSRLKSILTIPAKAFEPKEIDILQHWRQENAPDGTVQLFHGVAAPIGLDMDAGSGAGVQKDELRKLAREYIQSIVREPRFAEEMTASIRSTGLPVEVLRIVQTYALRSQSEIVKRALGIYATHYVMTRHLSFTSHGLAKLVHMGLASPNHSLQTPRLLSRQFKAILDEINLREMQLIFEAFSKSLKPKIRKEWAPCLAAFLVLTLFMEEVEISLDVFGTSQNQVNSLRGALHQYDRRDILNINREIENMPFKQFAYQFHQIYQTHSTDASTRPFNPLMDDSLLNDQVLDQPAIDMVRCLRKLLWDIDTEQELDFLAELDNDASHPYPSDLSCRYSGKLMARFLLSFQNIQRLLTQA